MIKSLTFLCLCVARWWSLCDGFYVHLLPSKSHSELWMSVQSVIFLSQFSYNITTTFVINSSLIVMIMFLPPKDLLPHIFQFALILRSSKDSKLRPYRPNLYRRKLSNYQHLISLHVSHFIHLEATRVHS